MVTGSFDEMSWLAVSGAVVRGAQKWRRSERATGAEANARWQGQTRARKTRYRPDISWQSRLAFGFQPEHASSQREACIWTPTLEYRLVAAGKAG